MKKKFSILNFVLSIAVLFSMLTQSVHSYEHVLKEFSEKKCYHKLTSGTEITHQHNKFHTCYLCNFSISSFLSTDAYSSELSNLILKSGSSLAISKETTEFFKGSLFALRAPPLV